MLFGQSIINWVDGDGVYNSFSKKIRHVFRWLTAMIGLLAVIVISLPFMVVFAIGFGIYKAFKMIVS